MRMFSEKSEILGSPAEESWSNTAYVEHMKIDLQTQAVVGRHGIAALL